MVKKVPSKFAREKGQNLKPFILSLLATTLVTHSNNSTGSRWDFRKLKFCQRLQVLTYKENASKCVEMQSRIHAEYFCASFFAPNNCLKKIILLLVLK